MSDTIETSAEQVSEERLRELADMTKHYVTARMNMWDGSPVGSIEVASMARELLSARTSTAPVTGAPLTADVAVLPADNSDYLRLVIDPKHGERAEYRISIGAADVLFHELAAMSGYGDDASPPPPQPGVRVTEEMMGVVQLKYVDGKLTKLTRPIIGIEDRTAQEVFDIMADRIRAALTASIPDSGEGKPTAFLWTDEMYDAFNAVQAMKSHPRMAELVAVWNALHGAVRFTPSPPDSP